MAIDFNQDWWGKSKKTYKTWWAGELDRAIIPVEIIGREPDRNEPAVPLLSQANCNDFSISPEDIVDRIDYELSKKNILVMLLESDIHKRLEKY